MLAVIYDDHYREIGRKRRRTRAQQGEKVVLKRLLDTIADAAEKAGITPDQINGIGIGCPGPVDPQNGIIRELTNLGWHNVKLAKIIQKEFGIPHVALANDVDAGTYGEYAFGAGRQAKSLLGVFPGTGIGGGFVHNDDIFCAPIISCMEIGHIQINPDGALCGCGRRGCLETIAGRLAIASAAAAAVYRGEAPALQKIAGTDLAEIRSGALAQSIREGDESIKSIVNHAALQLGRTIGGLINTLAPEKIVIGGGLAEALGDLMLDPIRQGSAQTVMPALAEVSKITAAKLQDDSVIKGAAAWVRRQATGNIHPS